MRPARADGHDGRPVLRSHHDRIADTIDSVAPPLHDIVIIGAGVAGLTLARELRRRGHAPVVLERSRGVGGRCATRRVDGVPVDHGVPFLHGHTDAFIAELANIPGEPLDGWPFRIEGDGTPCRPEAFRAHAHRRAVVEGVNRFAKQLAIGSDVWTEARVVSIEGPAGVAGVWALTLADGREVRARTLVTAVPPPSARTLLSTASNLPADVTGLLPVLALVPMIACLAVIARYREGTPAPPWHMAFPRESAAVHSVSVESSKHRPQPGHTLVIQARAPWSRARVATAPESWAPSLLDEAAARYGTWIGTPASFQGHAWRHARVAPGCELTQPLLVESATGTRFGCVGDGFHPAGGVEGAYLSGLMLAARLDRLHDRH